ncbi:MAG: AbrB/MazE/SpoVT family DNA-binding domain-containing protein [Alphaproteobacteria bacterium]|nr:AbrB/MazE/SpoVT family DNA-binding domain-containing protein [Alphaproteobacteria bacterium]
MKAHIAKWGNSLAVRLPKPLLERLNLQAGAELEVLLERGGLSLRPVQSDRARLASILAEMDRLGAEAAPAFEEPGTVGAEIIQDAYGTGS